jgi:hypothetical protein
MLSDNDLTFLHRHFHQYPDLKTSIKQLQISIKQLEDLVQNVLKDELSQSFVKQELSLKIETGVEPYKKGYFFFAHTKCNFKDLCCYFKVFFNFEPNYKKGTVYPSLAVGFKDIDTAANFSEFGQKESSNAKRMKESEEGLYVLRKPWRVSLTKDSQEEIPVVEAWFPENESKCHDLQSATVELRNLLSIVKEDLVEFKEKTNPEKKM